MIEVPRPRTLITSNLEKASGLKIESVDCPSDVEVEVESDLRVHLRHEAGGKEETATLKILNEDADVSLATSSRSGQ